jgi:predicted DNA-binding transcriptional regulator YafY
MERSQRMARINALVSRPLGVSMAQLIEELEVSRATINRDIELLRSQLNTPIVWDHDTYSYRLEAGSAVGDRYMLPGVWLTPEQAYAFLTLNNMVEQMAPSLLGPFLLPMRGMLKEMLCQAEFPLYRLNEKIEIEMPGMPTLNDQAFALILDAVVKDQELEVGYRETNGEIVQVQGIPKRLKIAPTGWILWMHTEAGQEVSIELGAVTRAKLLRD